MSDESSFVHFQVGEEAAARALISISAEIEAAVYLCERFEREGREAQPGGLDPRFLTDLQIEPANGEQVGGWAEIQIQIDAAACFRALSAIEEPAVNRIDGEFDLHRLVSHPAGNSAEKCPPVRIADNQVIQPARAVLMSKNGRSDKMPVWTLQKQPGGLMAG
jgi:hypothetical protein